MESTITVVRPFLPDGVFLVIPCDQGLDFLHSSAYLCENSINSVNQSIKIYILTSVVIAAKSVGTRVSTMVEL